MLNFDSVSAIAIFVFKTESGFNEIDSIPRSTKNWAKSGKSEGPCPQIPIYLLLFLHTFIASSISSLTASFFSFPILDKPPLSLSNPSVN